MLCHWRIAVSIKNPGYHNFYADSGQWNNNSTKTKTGLIVWQLNPFKAAACAGRFYAMQFTIQIERELINETNYVIIFACKVKVKNFG